MSLFRNMKNPPNLVNPADGLQRQIQNLETRLGSVNMDMDSRNPIEKALNLRDENILFQALDLLERPFQGITQAVSSVLSPKDIRSAGEAFKDGVTGKKSTSYRNVLEDLGVESKIAKNIVGTGMDLILDPVNLIPGSAISKGAKAVGKGVKNITPEPIKKSLEPITKQLENMFSVEQPLRRTIQGGEAEGVVDARRSFQNQQRYEIQQVTERLDEAMNLAGGKDKGIDIARLMQQDVGSDINSPQYLERIKQAFPNNPPENIQKAVKIFEDSFAKVRQLGMENGISIPDNPGYMPLVLTREASEHFNKMRGQGVSSPTIGLNPKVFAERKYKGMTAEEANALYRKENNVDFDLFETNAFDAVTLGLHRQINGILAESFKKDVLSQTDFAIPLANADITDLPKGLMKIRASEYNFIEDVGGELVSQKSYPKAYAVTPEVKTLLDKYKKATSDAGIEGFLKGFDKLQNEWKALALFSAGYHARNMVGNAFNAWISGMPLSELGTSIPKAVGDIRLANNASRKQIRGEALTAKEKAVLDEYDAFRRQGLRESSVMEQEFMYDPEKMVRERLDRQGRGFKGSDIYRKPLEASRQFGLDADEVSRFAYFRWAKSQGDNVTDAMAGEKVREVLFDYGDLTEFESRIMRRVMPFYTWTRKNIPYQLYNFAIQPKKYVGVDKLRSAGIEMTGNVEEDLPEWLNNALAIPLGENKFANLALPMADLHQLDPSEIFPTITGLASPALKLPFELGQNVNLFTGRPIKDFEGQTEKFMGLDIPANLAHVINQAGAVRNLSRNAEKLQDRDWLSLLTGNIVRQLDPEKQEMSNLYEDLNRLQDLLKLYEQQTGNKVPTLAELGK